MTALGPSSYEAGEQWRLGGGSPASRRCRWEPLRSAESQAHSLLRGCGGGAPGDAVPTGVAEAGPWARRRGHGGEGGG